MTLVFGWVLKIQYLFSINLVVFQLRGQRGGQWNSSSVQRLPDDLDPVVPAVPDWSARYTVGATPASVIGLWGVDNTGQGAGSTVMC